MNQAEQFLRNPKVDAPSTPNARAHQFLKECQQQTSHPVSADEDCQFAVAQSHMTSSPQCVATPPLTLSARVLWFVVIAVLIALALVVYMYFTTASTLKNNNHMLKKSINVLQYECDQLQYNQNQLQSEQDELQYNQDELQREHNDLQDNQYQLQDDVEALDFDR
ncbi:MAG: hypothetical protein RR133_00585 [Kiritimatiellia bacterium]